MAFIWTRLFAVFAALVITAGHGHAGEATDSDQTDSAHDFLFSDIDGAPLPLSTFAGQPVLVVNTASRCAFTHQYDALQALYDTYRERGLVVLGVPSDDFGGQELATESDVKNFCKVNFAIDFPMTEITQVRGRGQHPFYAWAEEAIGPGKIPRWNFHKYLLAPDGSLVASFDTTTPPDAIEITQAVENLLKD